MDSPPKKATLFNCIPEFLFKIPIFTKTTLRQVLTQFLQSGIFRPADMLHIVER